MRKLSFNRVYEGYYKVFADSSLIAYINKNPNYSRYPWLIEYADGRHFVDKHGYDCFTFNVAKSVIREEIERFLA